MAGRSSLVGFVALLVLAGGAFSAVWSLTAQRVEPPPPPAFADPPVDEKASKRPKPESPRAAFGHMCGTCHTLRAAHTTGLFGPNLDEARPSAARVRHMIRTGTPGGIMPANLLSGREARDVAGYVARVAG